MGYYSEVALVLAPSAVNKLKQAVAKVDEKSEKLNFVNYPDKHLTDYDGNELYYWESVKWYEDFPETQFMEEFMDSLDPEEYRFLRVGESEGDTDEGGGIFYNHNFGVYSLRGIHINKPTIN